MSSLSATPSPTLQEIAARAGVSASTVGLVLNGRGDKLRISQRTQARIRQAAEDLNYAPNYLARGLSGQRTQSVGIVWSLCGPHDSVGAVQYLAHQSYQRGYTAHIAESMSDTEPMTRVLRDFSRRMVDGVILQVGLKDCQDHATFLRQNAEWLKLLEGFHAVVLVTPDVLHLPYDRVEQSCRPAYGQAVDHLLRQGRRRWAMVSNDVVNYRKYHAIRSAMAERGLDATDFACHYLTCLPDESGLVMRSPVPVPGQSERIRQALAEIDAVFCSSDNMAAVVMRWLQEAGRRVPEDIAVIGYNDQFLGTCLSPPLASIARNDLKVVEAAAELFFDRLENGASEPRYKSIDPRFVPRASAGP